MKLTIAILLLLVLSACGREQGCWYHIDQPPDGARWDADCK